MASRTLLLLFLVLAAATTGTSPDAAAAVPLRGHVEPAARTPPMHSARSKEGAAA